MRSESSRVILLHGPSSSGKSTIARAVQAQIEMPFWHYSIDHLRDAHVLPSARIRTGEFSWPSLRSAFFGGFHASVGAFATAGNNLIVEHIVETQAWMDSLVDLLAEVDVFFVRVSCPLPELERRERQRGDRPLGDARRDFEAPALMAEFDLELDSTDGPEENAPRLIGAWRDRRRPSAFERMRAGRSKP